MNNNYLAAYLACNPNAGALLGNHSNSVSLEDSSSSSASLSAGMQDNTGTQLAASLNSELNAARNSALLNQLLQQRQIDELRQQQQQRSLLASLSGSGAASAPAVSDNAVFLALLRKKQEQDQQALQQKQLQELQACMGLMESNSQNHLLLGHRFTSQYASVGGPSSEILAAASLAGLGVSSQPSLQMESATSSYASLLQQQHHLAMPTAQVQAPILNGQQTLVQPDVRRKGRSGKFPHKLHQMLSDLEALGRGDIASFMPHGRAFAIHKPAEFTKDIMPKYFRMSRFSSFQRQLNLYDFQRIAEGHDKGSYFHKLFVMGQPILCSMMKRNKIKGVKLLQKNDAVAKKPSPEERKPATAAAAAAAAKSNQGDDDDDSDAS